MAISDGFANTGSYGGAATAPTYAQSQAQRYGFGGGTAPSYGMAGAGQQYGGAYGGQQYGGNTGQYGGNTYRPYSMAGAGNAAAAPAAAAPAAATSTPLPAGTPSTAGATTPNPGGTYVNGQWVPSITQTTTLSPEEQKILQGTQTFQQSMLGAGNQLAGAIPTGGLDLSGAPAMPTAGQYNQSAADAVYQQQTAMLDPQWNTQQQQLTDTLRDQGIPEGSAAWQQQMDQFDRQRTLAYQQAKDAAIQEGYNVSNQQFQQGMSARQQGVSEAGQQYQMPVSNLATLMGAYTGTGGVQAPQGEAARTPISPADMSGNFQTAQQALQNQYAAQAQQYGANVGGLSGLAGMLAMGAMMSPAAPAAAAAAF
jgi:hypothetical protein